VVDRDPGQLRELLAAQPTGGPMGLEAFVRLAYGEPLWRIHECVFAVLALESEPVDPRL
jgi:hypothetical protein